MAQRNRGLAHYLVNYFLVIDFKILYIYLYNQNKNDVILYS